MMQPLTDDLHRKSSGFPFAKNQNSSRNFQAIHQHALSKSKKADHSMPQDRPFRSTVDDHLQQIQEETIDCHSSTRRTASPTPTSLTEAHIDSTAIPLIVITDDEARRDIISASNQINQTSKATYPSVSFTHMDNMNPSDCYNASACPNSPGLSLKNASLTSNTSNLSPPPPSPSTTPHLSLNSKRRGLNHRASYKRAHTGRLSVDHTPNELFIELQELRNDRENEFYWYECARWIRYEEDFDTDILRWQAPRVGCLNFHSLLELRRGLQYGTVLFDLDEQTLEGIYDAILNDAIANGQMNKDGKDEVLRLLISDHQHPEPRSAFRRRSSVVEALTMSARRSSLAFRRSEQLNAEGNRRMSLLEQKNNGELNKNLRNLVVKYDHIDELTQVDSNPKRNSEDQINVATSGSNESVNQMRPSPNHHRISQIQAKKPRDSFPYKSDVLRRIAENAECAEVLVGNVRQLSRPVMALVRLSQGHSFLNMTEVPLPVKFLFILVGPPSEEYVEVGRCLGTLFTTSNFREIAYQAMDRRDLLNGINDFLSDSIVLPPGEFDKELILPIIATAKEKHIRAKRRSTRKQKRPQDRIHEQQPLTPAQSPRMLLATLSSLSHEKQDEDPFMRSGSIFGGVYREMHRRYAYFKSDFLDALSLHCLVSLVFMFIACLAPALTFGGIIGDKTSNRLGVNEMLIASSMNGLLFGLFSGQPLLILGPTGPFLVFEEMVYDLCQLLNADFWTVRCCVSLWTTFFIIVLVAFEGSFMIRHVTRFTEEIFALIIALVYLYEPFKKLYKIFLSNPVRSNYNYEYPLQCFCNSSSTIITLTTSVNTSIPNYSCHECFPSPIAGDETPLPNKALLSLIILLGTCFIAVALKRFRRSKFFGRTSRQTLSDFGMTIALIFMVLFDMLVTKSAGGQTLTQKISVPHSIRPSDRERGNLWFISPFRHILPFWVYFASSFPAVLISVVLFFEVELTSIMIQSKLKCVHSTKGIKGTGYHLDILIAGLLISVNGLFGLPWICAAPVRSIAHIASLSKYSNTHAPGEKARLIDIKDQRVTNIGVHLLIGCTIFAAPIIRRIPVAALFGIFLYFGIVSIPGTQLFTRLKMTFIPTKYHPNVGYLRRVRQMKRNLYTFIQIIAAGLLITIKVTNFAFLFPLILVLLVPFRIWCLPLIFTERELNELDGDEEPGSIFDDDIDFYGQVHLPI